LIVEEAACNELAEISKRNRIEADLAVAEAEKNAAGTHLEAFPRV